MHGSQNGLHVGISAWTMQTSERHPTYWPALYADLVGHARRAEELGYDSVWFAEHHFWPSGYCPSPLTAAAYVAGVTERIQVGASVLLIAQHSDERVRQAIHAFEDFAPERLLIAAGLGWSEEEFAAVGLTVADRGRVVDERLDALIEAGEPIVRDRLWVATSATVAVKRAARRRLPILTSGPSLDTGREMLARYRDMVGSGDGAGPVAGVQLDIWPAEDKEGLDYGRRMMNLSWHNYARGKLGWRATDAEVEDYSNWRTDSRLLTGSPEEVTARIQPYLDLGFRALVLRVNYGVIESQQRLDDAMRLTAEAVVPALRLQEEPVR
jgi:alkanesulfonate monooxygenase SsuD/methylene tetrahydromethanopterin reductase-like flavin-dependent oxidoreductase (luciferase family)